jgi:hypothetical protein
VEGNPFLLFDLERVNFQFASSIFVSSPPRGVGNDPAMADADAIFIVRMIEAELRSPQNTMLREGRPPPPVTVEITLDSNHHFLPMPKMGGIEDGIMEDDEDEEEDELTATNVVEEVGKEPKPTSKFARLLRMIRGRAKAVKKKTAPSSSEPAKPDATTKKSARSAAADAQQLQDQAGADYLRQPRYACGQLFVSSIVTSLAVNSFYNPSLAHMIEGMIDAQIVMVDVGKGWHREPFYDFYKHVLENRDLLAIGIFRKVMVEKGPAGGFSESSKAKERLQGKKKKKAKSIFALLPDNYVFSSPPAKSANLTQDDTVICIMKKDWSKIPDRYGPQLRSMDYKKHGNLKNTAMALQGASGMNQTQSSGNAASFAIGNGTGGTMNTTANSQMVANGNTTATTMSSTAHHPPPQQAVGTWSAMRENAGSSAVGGPLALPPPPGVKGPTNPNGQLAIPGQL